MKGVTGGGPLGAARSRWDRRRLAVGGLAPRLGPAPVQRRSAGQVLSSDTGIAWGSGSARERQVAPVVLRRGAVMPEPSAAKLVGGSLVTLWSRLGARSPRSSDLQTGFPVSGRKHFRCFPRAPAELVIPNSPAPRGAGPSSLCAGREGCPEIRTSEALGG